MGNTLVTIADNGQGFVVDQGLAAGGKGLSSQQRRAATIGAEIKLESNAAGTVVTLRLPIKQPSMES